MAVSVPGGCPYHTTEQCGHCGFTHLVHKHVVGPLGQGIGPAQGLYPHSTTQTQQAKTYI
jgi:hypothetical protein